MGSRAELRAETSLVCALLHNAEERRNSRRARLDTAAPASDAVAPLAAHPGLAAVLAEIDGGAAAATLLDDARAALDKAELAAVFTQLLSIDASVSQVARRERYRLLSFVLIMHGGAAQPELPTILGGLTHDEADPAVAEEVLRIVGNAARYTLAPTEGDAPLAADALWRLLLAPLTAAMPATLKALQAAVDEAAEPLLTPPSLLPLLRVLLDALGEGGGGEPWRSDAFRLLGRVATALGATHLSETHAHLLVQAGVGGLGDLADGGGVHRAAAEMLVALAPAACALGAKVLSWVGDELALLPPPVQQQPAVAAVARAYAAAARGAAAEAAREEAAAAAAGEAEEYRQADRRGDARRRRRAADATEDAQAGAAAAAHGYTSFEDALAEEAARQATSFGSCSLAAGDARGGDANAGSDGGGDGARGSIAATASPPMPRPRSGSGLRV